MRSQKWALVMAAVLLATAVVAVVGVCNLLPSSSPASAAQPLGPGVCDPSGLAYVSTGRFPRGGWVVPARWCGPAPHAPTYKLVLQGDGNLVLYWLPKGYAHPALAQAVWSSQTQGHPYDHAYMQADGNFVIYSRSHQALWDSGTAGCGNAEAVTVNGPGNRLYPGFWMLLHGGSANRSVSPARCTFRFSTF